MPYKAAPATIYQLDSLTCVVLQFVCTSGLSTVSVCYQWLVDFQGGGRVSVECVQRDICE